MTHDEARKKMLKLRKYPMAVEDAIFLDNLWFEMHITDKYILTDEDVETLNDICNRYGNDGAKPAQRGQSVPDNAV